MTTLSLVTPEGGSHWYDGAGNPVYTVPYADPKREGEYRSTTLRDARSMKLFPSTTNVLGVVARPGLEAWKQSQMILAALTLPRLPAESLDEFATRVVKDGQEEAKRAAEAGTLIHDAIETYLWGEVMPDGALAPFIEGFAEWWWRQDLETECVEQCFCRPDLGYGGRVDWIGNDGNRLVIIDWKTSATKPGQRVGFYDEWAMQEASYAKGVCRPGARLISVVVSRTEPGRIEQHEWTRTPGERERWWAAFESAKALWCLTNNYFPAQPVGELVLL